MMIFWWTCPHKHIILCSFVNAKGHHAGVTMNFEGDLPSSWRFSHKGCVLHQSLAGMPENSEKDLPSRSRLLCKLHTKSWFLPPEKQTWRWWRPPMKNVHWQFASGTNSFGFGSFSKSFLFLLFLFSFPTQFTVGVLNDFLVCQLCLECFVCLAGFVFLLSPVLTPIWSGMQRPDCRVEATACCGAAASGGERACSPSWLSWCCPGGSFSAPWNCHRRGQAVTQPLARPAGWGTASS